MHAQEGHAPSPYAVVAAHPITAESVRSPPISGAALMLAEDGIPCADEAEAAAAEDMRMLSHAMFGLPECTEENLEMLRNRLASVQSPRGREAIVAVLTANVRLFEC